MLFRTLLRLKKIGVYTLVFLLSPFVMAQTSVTEYRGTVKDVDTNRELEFVSLNLKGSNISTITNSEGDFILKVPSSQTEGMLLVSLLGYQTKEIPLSSLDKEDALIELKVTYESLSQISVDTYSNPEALVRTVFKQKEENNQDQPIIMTAFYRETIKKRNRDVSLTEAVVNLNKKPYTSRAKDEVSLHKARKSTNYRLLDTVAVKLQGGPFSTLYIDMMKYPEYIFNDNTISAYDFKFEKSTTVNNRPVYVVNFKQKEEIQDIGYYGKLYIDSESLALASADYSLDVSDSRLAKDLLVKKKPSNVTVYPKQADYRVNYVQRDGKWYYGYGSVALTFIVDKKRKLFNSEYTLSSEMAITDWQVDGSDNRLTANRKLKPTVIISDAVSGFSDPDFWGEYNLIEPEKSIESAINKIQRRLKREGSSTP